MCTTIVPSTLTEARRMDCGSVSFEIGREGSDEVGERESCEQARMDGAEDCTWPERLESGRGCVFDREYLNRCSIIGHGDDELLLAGWVL